MPGKFFYALQVRRLKLLRAFTVGNLGFDVHCFAKWQLAVHANLKR